MQSTRYHARVWCVWGALLAAIPHLTNIKLHEASVAPTAFGQRESALALMLAILALNVCPRAFLRRLCSILSRSVTIVAIASVTFLIACEAPSIARAFGSYLLSPYARTASIFGSIAQVASLSCWSLFGIACIDEAEGAKRSNVLATRGVTLALFLALMPLAQFVADAGPKDAANVITLCAICGLCIWHVCRLAASGRLGKGGVTYVTLLALAGYLCSSLLRASVMSLERSLDALGRPSWMPSVIMLLGTVYVAIVCATALAKSEWQVEKPQSPKGASSRLSLVPAADTLSNMQRGVLELVIEGMSTAQIASRLGISAGTVGTHRARGLERLGLSTTSELLRVIEGCASDETGAEPTEVTGGATLLLAAAVAFLAPAPAGIAPAVASIVGIAVMAGSVRRLPLEGGSVRGSDASDGISDALPLAASSSLALALGLSWFEPQPLRNIAMLGLVCAWSLCEGLDGNEAIDDALRVIAQGGHRLLARSPWCGMAFVASLGACGPLHDARLLELVAPAAALSLAAVLLAHSFVLPVKNAASIEGDPSTTDYLLSRGLGELEAQVTILIARRYTQGQIQRMLNIAPGTVSSCRANAYRKLGVHSADQLRELLKETRLEMRA